MISGFCLLSLEYFDDIQIFVSWIIMWLNLMYTYELIIHGERLDQIYK